MMKYSLSIFLILVGVSVGMGIQKYYPLFKFEEKIDPIGLVTLVVTVFLAVYVPIFLERNLHNKRSEKDVIIRKIESLQKSIDNVNQIVSECIQKQTVSMPNSYLIINNFTTISNELDTVITLINYCSENKFTKEFEEMKNFRFQYRKIVTGGNFQKKGFKFTILDKTEEEKIYHKFDKLLSLLILKVNRL